jgi:copper chaperone CopZ
MKEKFSIMGMSCAACSAGIERTVCRLDGIIHAEVSLMGESMSVEYDGERDFFEYVTDVVVGTLLLSYDLKMKFNRYVFEYDSVTQSNYAWYMQRIKTLFAQGKAKGAIRADVDEDALSYAIWCFCRGYNADAVERNLPKDEAVQKFRYSFSILLDGLKVK